MGDFKKNLIRVLIISSLVVLILGGLLVYFRIEIGKKVIKIDEYKKELASRDDILNRIHNLEQGEALSLSYLSQLQDALPTESEAVRFEGMLQDLAHQNDLSLSFRFGELNEPKDSEPKSYNFNLLLSGTKSSILKWLAELKGLTYRAHLEQIEFNQKTTEDSNLLYDVKILGRIYIR
ncbi:MAG: hypothetical protein PHG13_01785 [Candidatus Pacebacteria bacterium]|nr:hypothetical protein [Candidatus Paceibacterota bacterium]MDD5721834.1 hypothetical protein [Candidatus Paceibacterota bacterium]